MLTYKTDKSKFFAVFGGYQLTAGNLNVVSWLPMAIITKWLECKQILPLMEGIFRATDFYKEPGLLQN
jgi:hypothetical protein